MARKKVASEYEAVFFMEGNRVFRQMLKTEFEALLDGYVGLSDMSDSEATVVYVILNKQLKITSLVFFTIYFDEEGRADPEWNLPIEELAKKGGSGPDLGGGPIKLACRSQCPINWHQKELWDPSMKAGMNDFQVIRKAVQENRLGFEMISEAPVQHEQVPVMQPAQFSSAEDIPVLSDTPTLIPSTDSAEAHEHRTKLARLIKEQRLRIKTLENQKQDELDNQAREFRIDVQQNKHRVLELEQSLEQLKVLNEQLKKKLFDRNEQYISLQDRVADQTSLIADLQAQLRGTENIEEERAEATNLKSEIVILKEQMDRQKQEAIEKDEKIEQLESELEDLQERHEELRNEGSLFEKLHELDVVFMAYHPGAGHVTIPFVDIKRYAKNPVAYVASKCFVKEEEYLEWLKHYENPVCQEPVDGGVCGSPLSVVHAPNEYKPDFSNRCGKHRSRF